MALTAKQMDVRLNNRQIKMADLTNLLTALPKTLKPKAERHVAEYLREAFETDEPAYNLKHRADAYGKSWFSNRQRAFVMAKMRREGRLVKTANGWRVTPKNNRTGQTGRQWIVTGRGPVTIKNTAKHAGWLFSDKYQARQPKLVGWKKLKTLYDDNVKGAIEDLEDYLAKEILKALK
jgi:hypothetical protein